MAAELRELRQRLNSLTTSAWKPDNPCAATRTRPVNPQRARAGCVKPWGGRSPSSPCIPQPLDTLTAHPVVDSSTCWSAALPRWPPRVSNCLNGYRIAHITCRACGRIAKLPATKVPSQPNDRLRCRACGHRGADYVLAWHTDDPDKYVVGFRPRKR